MKKAVVLKSIGVVASLLQLAGCTSVQNVSSVKPESVGVSAGRLEHIDRLMNDYVEAGRFPGMQVSVMCKGELVYAKEFGYSDVETRTPLKSDDIFRIYSMTKAVTGVGVMILFEEGRFMLDDPVSKYIPAFERCRVFDGMDGETVKTVPLERAITIRDLLSQTAGLGNGWEKSPTQQLYNDNDPWKESKTLDEFIEKLVDIPLCFQPGADWKYSDSITVLGRLIEIWSGKSLDRFFQDRIFDPLGMTETGFYVPNEKWGRLTKLYKRSKDGGFELHEKNGMVDGWYKSDTVRPLGGGGGLVSTSADFLRFCRMLLNGGELDGVRLLSPRTVKLMATDALPEGVLSEWPKMAGHGYGFAVSVQTDNAQAPTLGSVGDYGWDGYGSTWFRIDPKEELVILLLTHMAPTDREIQIKLKTLVYQAMLD